MTTTTPTTTRTVVPGQRRPRTAADRAIPPALTPRRARAGLAVVSVLAAGSATAALWVAVQTGETAPTEPRQVPLESSLPRGIDGSDVRLHHRAAELRALQEAVDGSDRHLYLRPGSGSAATVPQIVPLRFCSRC